jgi:hypothetical protein
MDNDYLHKFNRTFKELVNDLIGIFPDDPDLHMYKAALSAAIMVEETILIEKFHEKVVVLYGDEILKKNISFFLSNPLHNGNEDSHIINFINNMKEYYQSTLPENQEIIWKYCKVLVLLCTKWYNIQQNTQ